MKLSLNPDIKVLVLLAHPNMANSKMNKALAEAAAQVAGVQVVNIYDYPVDVETYREAVTAAKAIVFQFPFYFRSAPHMLKQWTDEVHFVLNMEGIPACKDFMVVTTTGSEEEAYLHDGRHMYTMEEYLRPFEGMARHAGMTWHKPIVAYGNPANAELAQKQLAEAADKYQKLLLELIKHEQKSTIRIKEVLSIESKPWKDDFGSMALDLMAKYIIRKGNVTYEFAEIEFYLYCEEHKDTSVYPRACKAGDFFYHYSGMDIAFETCTEEGKIVFGGILIRSLIRKGHQSDKNGEGLIAGPLRCKDELLNGHDIAIIEATPTSKNIKAELRNTTRQGIKEGGYQNKPYRYYLPRKDWNHAYIKSLSYNKDREIVHNEEKKDTYSRAPKDL